MSGLVLKLAPREQIVVNGVLIENGDRRARLSIMTPDANVLRMREALSPEEVTTPVRRVCYIAQQALSGTLPPDVAQSQLSQGICDLSQLLTDPTSHDFLSKARLAADNGQLYPALKALRNLIPMEKAQISPPDTAP
nr:flagellar biosynthesis repressor FlbT [uncultured Celeribacter sp.]